MNRLEFDTVIFVDMFMLLDFVLTTSFDFLVAVFIDCFVVNTGCGSVTFDIFFYKRKTQLYF